MQGQEEKEKKIFSRETEEKEKKLFSLSLFPPPPSPPPQSYRVGGRVREPAKQARGHAPDLPLLKGLRVLKGGLEARAVDVVRVALASERAQRLVGDSGRSGREALGGGQCGARRGLGSVGRALDLGVELQLRDDVGDVGAVGAGGGLFFGVLLF